MKAVKQREVVAMLASEGFIYDCEGRHPIYKHCTSGIRIPVPNSREVAPGTMRDIIRAIKRAKTYLQQ